MTQSSCRSWSYLFILATICAVAWKGLATPFITVLFSYLVLELLTFKNMKWVASIIFVGLVSVLIYRLILILREAFVTIPNTAELAVPRLVDLLAKWDLPLPFATYDEFRTFLVSTIREEIRGVLVAFGGLTTQFVMLILGFVVAISLYVQRRPAFQEAEIAEKESVFSGIAHELRERFRRFYISFKTVMGAQLAISAFNTIFTSIFLLISYWITGMPHVHILIPATFLCGLLPIVGNLLSNTLITGVALTVSHEMALAALAFLIVLHKFEYFLNGKIIGSRIHTPMWLTLLALIVGERLMGVPGLMLAPVLLHYIKVELSDLPLKPEKSAVV